jgi:hypothetical protein
LTEAVIAVCAISPSGVPKHRKLIQLSIKVTIFLFSILDEQRMVTDPVPAAGLVKSVPASPHDILFFF